MGVATSLMNAVVDAAKQNNISRIFAEVSITAKQFFEAKGFMVVNEQTIVLRGIELNNFVMERLI